MHWHKWEFDNSTLFFDITTAFYVSYIYAPSLHVLLLWVNMWTSSSQIYSAWLTVRSFIDKLLAALWQQPRSCKNARGLTLQVGVCSWKFFVRTARATVYSAPQPSISSYTYDVGQNVLIIMYTGDLLSSFLYVEYAVHEKSHYYGYHAGLRDLSEVTINVIINKSMLKDRNLKHRYLSNYCIVRKQLEWVEFVNDTSNSTCCSLWVLRFYITIATIIILPSQHVLYGTCNELTHNNHFFYRSIL